MSMGRKAALFIARQILEGRGDLEALKREAAKKYKLSEFPKNSEVMAAIPKAKRTKEIVLLLRKRPMRTLSGVTPVALMVRPEGSCKWNCIYCPFTGKAPKSYTGEEPAALRARQGGFGPERQVRLRLGHFAETGHPTDKCEAIVMGGTFLAMPHGYKREFILGMYEGFNRSKSRSIAEAKKKNEKAKHRVIGLTIETRPDICGKKEIDEMLGYGATRVELGVQNPSDRIYRLVNRGHGVEEVVHSTALLKDSAFKVCYHLMPGLPGSDGKKDIAMVKKVFGRQEFRPDMLKIYPTLVMPGTGLHGMWRRGEYEPYSSEKAGKVIAEMYRHIPEYVRVMRVMRDIPAPEIGAGASRSNLREIIEKELGPEGARDIRSREIGAEKFPAEEAKLVRRDYRASGGKEVFLSYEWEGKLIGFMRLRIPHRPFRKEIAGHSALVRELHVYGQEESIGKGRGKSQHRSFGAKLLAEAECVAREEFDCRKMVIISGVGARGYYYKFGYCPDGPYVSRKL